MCPALLQPAASCCSPPPAGRQHTVASPPSHTGARLLLPAAAEESCQQAALPGRWSCCQPQTALPAPQWPAQSWGCLLQQASAQSLATAVLRAVLLQPHCFANGASFASSSASTCTALPLLLCTLRGGLLASAPALSTLLSLLPLLPPLLLSVLLLLLLAKLRCWSALKAHSFPL